MEHLVEAFFISNFVIVCFYYATIFVRIRVPNSLTSIDLILFIRLQTFNSVLYFLGIRPFISTGLDYAHFDTQIPNPSLWVNTHN